MEIQFSTQTFKEGRTFVAHTRELDVSSCDITEQKAVLNLKEAVRLFLEEAAKMGTLEQILAEAGYFGQNRSLQEPKFVGMQVLSLTLPSPLSPEHARV